MIPVVLFFATAPAALALAIALKTPGRKRIAAWIDFALLATPLAVGGGGTAVLAAWELAWRTAVKELCVFVYCVGLLVLFLWAFIYVSRNIGGGESVLGFLFSVLVLVLFAFMGFWYLFAGAAWMGNDCEVTTGGEILVEERGFMCDVYYFTYHGPLVRGREILSRNCT